LGAEFVERRHDDFAEALIGGLLRRRFELTATRNQRGASLLHERLRGSGGLGYQPGLGKAGRQGKGGLTASKRSMILSSMMKALAIVVIIN